MILVIAICLSPLVFKLVTYSLQLIPGAIGRPLSHHCCFSGGCGIYIHQIR